MNYSQAYNRIALGLGSLMLAGCQSMLKPNTDTCMRFQSVRAVVFNSSSTEYSTDCNDGRTSFALLTRPGDPVGNALGFLLYMDQNKAAKAELEARMGGKDNVKVAPETVAGLLTSSDDTSRYMGLQIYLYQPEETRVTVNALLKANNVDAKSTMSKIMAENTGANAQSSDDKARDWAREHAKAPMGVAATTCANTPGCQRAVNANGVTYTFKKQPQ